MSTSSSAREKNVSATEVESVLYEHPSLKEVAVVGVADPIRDQKIKAFVAGRDCVPDPVELETFCRQRLAPFKVPTEWVVMDALPKTEIKGDIDKKVLRKMT
ncbi:acyl-coenzyme A synthetase/AMP-(fatty) acid ligase [Rhodoligotrophos appendicifer]|uniref:AMP-binding enzyme n=1 Tax=Rhodoligotrophos appendicifer TaxID=987056 RepID=UPI001184BF5F|nr:hypothetical protein [Rhodoligotrophos appendicifer]